MSDVVRNRVLFSDAESPASIRRTADGVWIAVGPNADGHQLMAVLDPPVAEQLGRKLIAAAGPARDAGGREAAGEERWWVVIAGKLRPVAPGQGLPGPFWQWFAEADDAEMARAITALQAELARGVRTKPAGAAPGGLRPGDVADGGR